MHIIGFHPQNFELVGLMQCPRTTPVTYRTVKIQTPYSKIQGSLWSIPHLALQHYWTRYLNTWCKSMPNFLYVLFPLHEPHLPHPCGKHLVFLQMHYVLLLQTSCPSSGLFPFLPHLLSCIYFLYWTPLCWCICLLLVNELWTSLSLTPSVWHIIAQ